MNWQKTIPRHPLKGTVAGEKNLTISIVLCLVPTSANVYTLQLRVKGYRFEVLVPTFDTVYVLQLRGYRFEVRMPTSAHYTHCSCVLKDIDLSY